MRPLLRLAIIVHVLAMCALVYALQKVDVADAITGDREAFEYWDEASVWLFFVVVMTYAGTLGGTVFVKWKNEPFVFFPKEGRWGFLGAVALFSPMCFVILLYLWAVVNAGGG